MANNLKILLTSLFLLIYSCAYFKKGDFDKPIFWKNEIVTNSYTQIDPSGSFNLNIEKKFKEKKFIFRSNLYSLYGGVDEAKENSLESVVSVSVVEDENGKKILKPKISQTTIWLEKNKYFTQLKLKSNGDLEVVTQSPDEKFNGLKKFKVNTKELICFYSALVECIIKAGLLNKSYEGSRNFLLIWDMFPFHNEQFSNLSSLPFQKAKIELRQEGDEKDLVSEQILFDVVLENQVMNFYLDENHLLDKMLWTAQGLSVKSQK